MPLSTLVVGCGAVAQRLYRKPLQQLERLRLVRVAGLVDPVTRHAESLGRFFTAARRSQDLDEALDAVRPDLTLILSPAHLHCVQTVAALRHGSHVLCEKPMAGSATECSVMNETASEARRILAVGMVRRFFPAYAQMARIVANGRLGTLSSFEYREGHKFEWDVTTPAAFRPRAEGGTGVLFDIGPHAIDHLEWTFGPLSVTSYADDALEGIESNAVFAVNAGPTRGVVHLAWNQPQANELRIAGALGEAVLRVGYFDQLAVRTHGGFEPQPIDVAFPADAQAAPRRTLTPRNYADAIYCQIVQVVRAIRLDEAPAADGEAGRRAVALLESALSMATPLEMPWLSVAEAAAFRRMHWSRTQ